MCAAPSTAVFCGESIECFRSMASKLFFKPSVRVLVAPRVTGTVQSHAVYKVCDRYCTVTRCI